MSFSRTPLARTQRERETRFRSMASLSLIRRCTPGTPRAGGRLVDFRRLVDAGPIRSIVAEHEATRTAAGLFDISHMGRLRFDGAGAEAFLDRLSRAASPTCSRARFAMPW